MTVHSYMGGWGGGALDYKQINNEHDMMGKCLRLLFYHPLQHDSSPDLM